MLVSRIFSFSHNVFQKASFSALLKMGLCGNGLTLPNDKILPSSTLFVENNFRMVDMVQFFFDRIENIVEKGENAGFQNFLSFTQCFQKACFSALLKMGLCGNGLTLPNDKILPSSTLFVENDFRMVDMVQFFFDRVENIVEKGERLVSGILSFSHNGFKRLLFQARENL